LIVRPNNPALAPALAEYLRARADYVVEERSGGNIVVSAVGSHRDGGRLDVQLYLRAWEATNGVAVLLDEAR
jgi:hypothetical protein